MRPSTALIAILLCVLAFAQHFAPASGDWIALALVVCAGIPHGAFDLRLAAIGRRDESGSALVAPAAYLAGVFAMIVLCMACPIVGFTLFLVVSAIHFFEGECNSTAPPSAWEGGLFGLGAIILPIGLHSKAAQAYMEYFIAGDLFQAIASPLLLLSYGLMLCMITCVVRELIREKGRISASSVERCLCLVGWFFLSPIAGFAIWFIGRHTLEHLSVSRELLKPGMQGFPVDFIVISILAIAGLLPFALRFAFSDIHQLFSAAICLIAGLTVPHVVVCHRLTPKRFVRS